MELNQKSVRFWDRMAPQFDKRASGAEQPPVKRAVKYLAPAYTVLDYGCATGTITHQIATHVKEVQGIDLSPNMIALANKKVAANNIKNVTYTTGSLYEAPYPDQSFDVILAFDILHLLQDVPPVFTRMHHLLKPGGLVITVTPCMGERSMGNVLQGLLLKTFAKLAIIPSMQFFKIAQLESLFIKNNFQLEESESLQNKTNRFMVARKVG